MINEIGATEIACDCCLAVEVVVDSTDYGIVSEDADNDFEYARKVVHQKLGWRTVMGGACDSEERDYCPKCKDTPFANEGLSIDNVLTMTVCIMKQAL